MSLATLPPPAAFHALVAAGANAVSPACPAPAGMHDYGIQAVETGTVSGGTIALQGSLNGINFFTLATWTVGTQSSGDIIFAVDKPCVALRAVLTGYSGTGTLDVWIPTTNQG